jgi:uncharacterized protein (DUF433 family)
MTEQTSIDVKEVLVDIRSGMSDSGLMTKYAVSPKDRKKLVSEFERLGILRQIKANELLRDIRRGKTNKEIMEKYQLSKSALKKIFEEITEARINVFGDRKGKPGKKRIRYSEILSDIRSRLPETQLMAKYGLSSRGLQSVFWKLVRSGAATWDELLGTFHKINEDVTRHQARQIPRRHPILSVRIFDEANRQNRGRVTDLSEKGIGVVGISVQMAQTKSFMLISDEIAGLDPFHVFATCRWVKTGDGGMPPSSGFEIVSIDERSRTGLHQLIESTTLLFANNLSSLPVASGGKQRRRFGGGIVQKRKISAKAVLNDLHNGLSDTQLMARHGLTVVQLQYIFRRMVGAGLMAPLELYERSSLTDSDLFRAFSGEPCEILRCPDCGQPPLEEGSKCAWC